MLYAPMAFMFVATMTALVMHVYGIFVKLGAGKFNPLVEGLQLIVAILLMVLAVLIVKTCLKELLAPRTTGRKATPAD